jgi:glyoxylate reductase
VIVLKGPKVYVTRQLFDKVIEFLKEHADVEVFEGEDNPIPREVLLKKVKEVEGLLCLLTDRIDTEIFDAGKNLKVVSNYAVGFNNIDIDEATKRGVYVTNTPGILTETTADCAFALMMCIARRIAEADRHTRNGGWIHAWGPKMFLGSDIHGKTLGILGMGRIGTAITKRARGFDMNVIYYDIIRRRDIEDELGIKYHSFRDLLKKSDFISIHVPLTDVTYHMIGEKELSSMKKQLSSSTRHEDP